MRGTMLIVLSLVSLPASAQEGASETSETASVDVGSGEETSSGAGVEDGSTETASTEAASTDAEGAVPAPPETDTAAARAGTSRSGALSSPRTRVPAAYDDEAPPPPSDAPLSAGAEVFIAYGPTAGIGLSGLSPAGALGALGGLDGSLLALRTDFVFAADARNFFGIGLAVAHSETDDFFSSSGGESNRVEVPLVAQLYFEDPRRGAAVPTLRIMPSFRWEGAQSTSMAWRAGVGGRLELGVGVTWFVLPWLALRFLGDVGAAAIVYYEGLGGNWVSALVGANVGIVVRM